MGNLSYQQFIAQEQSNGSGSNQGQNTNRISFFSLKNDGQEAYVRILHDSVDTFDIVKAHNVQIGEGFRNINCLRDATEPLDKCPLCAANTKLSCSIYIRMIQYTRGEDGGIVATPVVWQRSQQYISTLAGLIKTYGPLTHQMFKVVRHGKPRDMKTTYDILYMPPMQFPEEKFPIDTSAFDNYKALGRLVLIKTAEEMNEFLTTGSFPQKQYSNTDATPKERQSVPTLSQTSDSVKYVDSSIHARSTSVADVVNDEDLPF